VKEVLAGMTQETPEICILLASERSGTNFFRSLLVQMPGVSSIGEVCNTKGKDAKRAPLSFLRYRSGAPLFDEKFVYRDEHVQVELLDAYLDYLRTMRPKMSLIIPDIKYAHIHNFGPAWQAVFDQPFLLGYAAAKRIKIVHLIRRKPYRTAISNLYAKASGVWVLRSGENPPAKKITINREELQARAVKLAETINLFRNWLSDCHSVTISYEELSAETAACLARVRDFLGLKGDIPVNSPLVKTTPSYEEAITNFSEIVDLIDIDLEDLIAAQAHGRNVVLR
jgi:hypothetical protein